HVCAPTARWNQADRSSSWQRNFIVDVPKLHHPTTYRKCGPLASRAITPVTVIELYDVARTWKSWLTQLPSWFAGLKPDARGAPNFSWPGLAAWIVRASRLDRIASGIENPGQAATRLANGADLLRRAVRDAALDERLLEASQLEL